MKNTIHLFICLLAIYSCSSNTQKYDLLCYNGNVYTVNDKFETAEAFVVHEGRILAVGTQEELRKEYACVENLDLEGQFVYPGFNDAHAHFFMYASGLNQVNLFETNSEQELIERVQLFSQTNESEVIVGHGWDQNDWPSKEFPTKRVLDSLFPNKMVVLTRVDFHAMLINQAVVDYFNIDVDSEIEGGLILKDSDSNFTGVLIDNAMGLFELPPKSKSKLIQELLQAQENCLAFGLTSITEAGLTMDEILLLDSIQEAGMIKIRFNAMLRDNEKMLKDFLQRGAIEKERLRVKSVKAFADGALGSRGACLLHSYSDKVGHHGLMLSTHNHFKELAKVLHENGWQMNTHAIGDSANRVMLNIYANELGKSNDDRWRIEHAQLVHPDDFKLFKEFNIIPSVQPTHATSDMYWAEERLGDRIKDAYAYKRLLDLRGVLPLGTDFPIEDISTLKTFLAAVVRKDQNMYPNDGFQADQALSREECLRGMTYWPAYASFEENVKGTLEAGMYADFIVLDQDLMQVEPKEILNIKVEKTFINGELVFSHKD